jgi:hypothetical protein
VGTLGSIRGYTEPKEVHHAKSMLRIGIPLFGQRSPIFQGSGVVVVLKSIESCLEVLSKDSEGQQEKGGGENDGAHGLDSLLGDSLIGFGGQNMGSTPVFSDTSEKAQYELLGGVHDPRRRYRKEIKHKALKLARNPSTNIPLVAV